MSDTYHGTSVADPYRWILESFADEIAFLLWQLGQPGFQPAGEARRR